MKIGTIRDLLGAQVICCEDGHSRHDSRRSGCDMMSDDLPYVKEQPVRLTGLVNLHVVRTAEMMVMNCIVFVRSKMPTAEMIQLAKDCGMVILSTDKRMYEACGILYSNGLVGNRVKNA